MSTAAQRVLGVRAGEGGLVARAAGLAMVAVGAQVLSLGTATALLLGARTAAVLPAMYAVSALLGVGLAAIMGAVAGRVSRGAEAAGAFVLFALTLVAARVLLPGAPWVVLALHPWCQVASSILVVQAFSLAGEHMDGVQARRLFPLVGAGGTVGAILAGLVMARLARTVGAANLLVLGAALSAVGGLLAVALVSRDRAAHASSPGPRGAAAPQPGALAGLREITSDRLLRLLAVSVAASTVAATVVRFAFERELSLAYPPDRIAAFLGGFNVAVNLAVLVVQMVAERRLLKVLGITFALAAAPFVLAGGTVMLWIGGAGLWAATAVRLLESVARFSLGRTGEELIAVPVPPLARRRARVVMTSLVVPAATLVAAGLIAVARPVSPAIALAGGIAAAAVGLAAVLATRQPYLQRLKGALRERRLKLGRGGDVPRVSADEVTGELRRELRALVGARLLEARVAAGPGDVDVLVADVAVHRRAIVERLFRLCSLVAAPAEMTRAWLAYASEDRNARGFALELMRHELPRPVARLLLPYLEDPTLEELLARAHAELGFTCNRDTPWPAAAAASEEPWQRWLALRYGGAAPRNEGEERMRELLEELYVLRKVELFSQLTAEELRPIAEVSDEIEVPPGTVLFQQGDPGDAFYIVLSGKLRVERDGRPIAAIGDHECFGEMALLDRGLRTATVITETACELSVIDSEDFDDLLSEHPTIARGMLAILARRLASASVM